MRKAQYSVLATLALTLTAGMAWAQQATTFEGTLVDSICYLKDNSLAGNDHGPMKDCGTMCLRAGTPAGLLTRDKKFQPILAPSVALAPYVGQTVRINGTVQSGAILASKVEVNRAGRWEEVKLGGMM
jgi:hypothetical protein